MAGGNAVIVINTQERAISPDINRLQAFANRDTAEIFRYLLDVNGNDDLDAGAIMAEPSTLETPLRAEVFNGLLVRPQVGSFNLLVDAGLLYAIAPDGGPDDSNYKYVEDAGVSVLGALTMSTNGTASIRIDVIEARINPVPLVTTDNRDIFNPITGLFVAGTVTKETEFRLEYRVRLGTAGAGYPAAVEGWLPLAIASVPAGASSNDNITFWDVRPLLNDRAYGISALTNALPELVRTHVVGNLSTFSPDCRVAGVVEGILNGRRIGGRLRNGTPGTSHDYVNVAATANQDAAFGFAGESHVNLYLATPFGLPRWARYGDAPSDRVPRSPRGIAIASATNQPNAYGLPTAAIALPAGTGLGGSTSDALLVASSYYFTVGPDFAIDGDGWVSMSVPRTNSVAGNVTTNEVDYDLVPGVDFPANATMIEGTLSGIAHSSLTSTYALMSIFLLNSTSATAASPGTALRLSESFTRVQINADHTYSVAFRFALPSPYPSATPVSLRLAFLHNTGVNWSAVATLEVTRYKIGP